MQVHTYTYIPPPTPTPTPTHHTQWYPTPLKGPKQEGHVPQGLEETEQLKAQAVSKKREAEATQPFHRTQGGGNEIPKLKTQALNPKKRTWHDYLQRSEGPGQ